MLAKRSELFSSNHITIYVCCLNSDILTKDSICRGFVRNNAFYYNGDEYFYPFYSFIESEEKSVTLPSNVVQSLVSPSSDPKEIVLQLKKNLHLDLTDLENPTPETKRVIRCFAEIAKDSKRIDVVRHLREITPAGTTGEFACIIWLSVNSFIHQLEPRRMKPGRHLHFDRTAPWFQLEINLL